MKKTIILFVFLLIAVGPSAMSQLSFEAHDDYGQLYDILFDSNQENTLYARTVGNHIVKSSDSGDTWQILYSDPMVQYCTLRDLRLINNSESLSFIVKAEGTAYNKVVVLNLTDGTVQKEYNVPNPQESDILIASYDIYSPNNDIALLHTTYTINFGFTNEVFLTLDGGATWRSIYFSPDYRDISINNVAISPNNPDKLFLMRGVSPGSDMGGLFVSEDGGTTWDEKIPGNTYSAIAFNPDNSNDILLGTFYGYGTHQENLYRSQDGGDTWNVVPLTYTSMSNDNINFIKFNPTNPANIVVLEENEIIVTQDDGLTWEHQVYTAIDPEDYYYGLSVSFNPFEANDVIITTDFYPFRSLDGGITLSKLSNRFVNSTGRIDAHFESGGNHLYYGLRNGFIHKDLDSNSETGYRMRPLNNTFGATTFPYADAEVEGRIFNSSRFGMNSVLEMSTDHGANYISLYSSMMFLNIYTLATDPSNTDLIWFSFGEMAYKVDVTDVSMPIITEVNLPSTNLLYGIIIDPMDSDRITITQGTAVYSSTDGGATWENTSSGLETLVEGQDMILDAKRNPLDPNEYLLATTKGIYLSTNKGQNWVRTFEEFVDKVDFSNITSGHIVARNHYSDGFLYPRANSRIIYSTDAGQNWEVISGEALEYINSSSSLVRFYEDNADVFYGTFDTGLVRYNIDLSTLDVAQSQLKDAIAIYPNPASTNLWITAADLQIQDVKIYNIKGQLVIEVSENMEQIDISSLNSGVYLIKIETAKQTFFKRLLKK